MRVVKLLVEKSATCFLKLSVQNLIRKICIQTENYFYQKMSNFSKIQIRTTNNIKKLNNYSLHKYYHFCKPNCSMVIQLHKMFL